MPWFWASDNPNNRSDAYKSLDSASREFLEQHTPPSPPSSTLTPSPRDQTPAQPPSQPSFFSSSTPPPQPPLLHPTDQAQPPTTTPPQSLFPDGRYAHLWSTYTTTSPSPSSSTSTPSAPEESDPQSALTNLLSTYRSNRASSTRAALSNCVVEHMAEQTCLSRPSSHLSVSGPACKEESKEFNRCFMLQARLLRAMGWMDGGIEEGGRGEERREGMLGRADEIWGVVKKRERVRREGKGDVEREGRIDWGGGGDVAVERAEDEVGKKGLEKREEELWRCFREERKEKMKRDVEGLPTDQRVLELELHLAETKAFEQYGVAIEQYYDKELEDRRGRKAAGQSTLGDWLKWVGGWQQ